MQVGELKLRLLRPSDPEALIDELAFADDEFLPYWAELWPASLALANALPGRLDGASVVELGCGLGVPALVAAARGAHVTAIDWAPAAVELLQVNARRNGLELNAAARDWRSFAGSFDLVLASDVLYERRNVEPLLALLPTLAPEVLLAEPGRPAAVEFLRGAKEAWQVGEVAARVYRLTARPGPGRTIRMMLGRVLTAIATPFHSDGAVDYAGFQRLAQFLVENGSDGIVVAGTTGECPTLEDGERLDLVAAALEAVGDRATVVAGTGTYSTAHSVRLTEQAHQLGAHAFLVVTPYYNKPPPRGIVAHYEAIAAATDRPVVVYNIPSRVVVNIEPETISRLAAIAGIQAVKQANPDLVQARHIVETGLALYAGDDVLLQPFLELGAAGGICVHTHVVGPQVAEQVRAYHEGDVERARELDLELAAAYELLRIATNPIPIKAALNLLGHEVGGYRLPLVPPTDDELAQTRDCLARLGLLVSV